MFSKTANANGAPAECPIIMVLSLNSPLLSTKGSCDLRFGVSGSGSEGTHTSYPLFCKNSFILGCQNEFGLQEVPCRIIAFFMHERGFPLYIIKDKRVNELLKILK